MHMQTTKYTNIIYINWRQYKMGDYSSLYICHKSAFV